MIFYFSATGNTLWAAEQVAEATHERLINMAEAVRNGHFDYVLAVDERIGFSFPVHGWQLPKVVKTFIRNLHIPNATEHYCYALCTAGDNIGLTMDILETELYDKGMPLHSTFSLIMPESYVGLPFMDVDSAEKEQRKVSASATAIQAYLLSIVAREHHVHHEVRGRWPRVNTRMLGNYFHRRLVSDRKFHIVADRCVQCGKCVAVCPMDNMQQQENGMPSWLHTGNCLTCFACYHYCPEHAIEFGRQTRKKGQYYFGRNH